MVPFGLVSSTSDFSLDSEKLVCRYWPSVRLLPEANTTIYAPGSIVTSGNFHLKGLLELSLSAYPFKLTASLPEL